MKAQSFKTYSLYFKPIFELLKAFCHLSKNLFNKNLLRIFIQKSLLKKCHWRCSYVTIICLQVDSSEKKLVELFLKFIDLIF